MGKVYKLHLPWRKPLNELQLMTLRPYVPDVELRGRIDDVVRRVNAARRRDRAAGLIRFPVKGWCRHK